MQRQRAEQQRAELQAARRATGSTAELRAAQQQPQQQQAEPPPASQQPAAYIGSSSSEEEEDEEDEEEEQQQQQPKARRRARNMTISAGFDVSAPSPPSLPTPHLSNCVCGLLLTFLPTLVFFFFSFPLFSSPSFAD